MGGGEGEAPSSLTEALDLFAAAVMPHTRQMTGAEVATEAGFDLELARRLRRAMGLPDVPDGEAAFYEQDVEALERVRTLVERDGFDTAELLHMARILGLASSRMAEAVVSFWADRLVDRPASVDELDVAAELGAQRIEELERMVVYLFRRHLLDSASRRMASTEASQDALGTTETAVGFADLVGFTSLTEQLSEKETADLIERFEDLAIDRVVSGGGRVIKMIGDEVMFAADPHLVGDIALGLAESFDSPDLPSVRVGVAAGPVVAQAGDLYGPIVNLASRATMAARPGSVLVSPALAEILGADGRYHVHALRPHRLKGIGVVQLYVLRRDAHHS